MANPSKPNANCSDDLAAACGLSNRLSGGKQPSDTPPAEPLRYTRLLRPAAPASPAAHASNAPSAVSKPESSRTINPMPSAGFGAVAWNNFLAECALESHAEMALLMDPSGLIVGGRGALPQDEMQGVGARLMMAFEQADSMDENGASPAIALDLSRGVMYGFRLAESDGGRFTLGIFVPGPPALDTQQKLSLVLERFCAPSNIAI
ncbi:MAG: hypothetical protein IPP78_02060 [Holophagaceae bacterium]|nr:hypothetical protein [Holophagaceae bacterium]